MHWLRTLGVRSSLAVGCLSMGLAVLTSCGGESPSTLKEAWNPENAPSLFDSGEPMVYNEHPASVDLPDEKAPWSGSGWSTYMGGIARRWQVDTTTKLNYRSYFFQIPSADTLNGYSSSQLSSLSPAEKYDLMRGDFGLTYTRSIRAKHLRRVKPETNNIDSWFGLCHGWSAAAIYETPPGHKAVVKLKNGKSIYFYNSDIKALISQFYADAVGKIPSNQLGKRCRVEDEILKGKRGRISDPNCRDTNPGAFHMVMMDRIAVKKKPFVMEVDYGYEIWNKPIYGYDIVYGKLRKFDAATDSRSSYRADGTVFLIDVDMTIKYVASTAPRYSAAKRVISKKLVKYTLELNGAKEIIGGEWRSRSRPDFLWEYKEPVAHRNVSKLRYSSIENLIKWSQGSSPGIMGGSKVRGTKPYFDESLPSIHVSEAEYEKSSRKSKLTIKARVSSPYSYTLKAIFKGGKSKIISQAKGSNDSSLRIYETWRGKSAPVRFEFKVYDASGTMLHKQTIK